MRPVIYLAGPISKGDLKTNIVQADRAFLDLVKAGFAPINPMLSVYAGAALDGTRWANRIRVEGSASSVLPITHEEWMEIDLPVVARCDAVLRLPGESVGADREVAHARKCDVPVYTNMEKLILDRARLFRVDYVFQASPVNGSGGVGMHSLSMDSIGAWPQASPGQTVRFEFDDGLASEVHDVIDKFTGRAGYIPASFLERSDDPDDKTVASFLASFDSPVSPDTVATFYLHRRIA